MVKPVHPPSRLFRLPLAELRDGCYRSVKAFEEPRLQPLPGRCPVQLFDIFLGSRKACSQENLSLEDSRLLGKFGLSLHQATCRLIGRRSITPQGGLSCLHPEPVQHQTQTMQFS